MSRPGQSHPPYTSWAQGWLPPQGFESIRVNPALIVLIVAVVFHVGAALFLSLVLRGTTPGGLGNLIVGTQFVFAIMAAVAAYRMWEGEASGALWRFRSAPLP